MFIQSRKDPFSRRSARTTSVVEEKPPGDPPDGRRTKRNLSSGGGSQCSARHLATAKCAARTSRSVNSSSAKTFSTTEGDSSTIATPHLRLSGSVLEFDHLFAKNLEPCLACVGLDAPG